MAVPVYKTWKLGPGLSEYPVAFELYRHIQGGDPAAAVRVENPDTDFSGAYLVEFRNLPKYDASGAQYVYTVRETVGGRSYADGNVFASPGGALTAVSITPSEKGGYAVCNTVYRADEPVSLTVRKVWRGGGGGDVTVRLWRSVSGGPAAPVEGRALVLGERSGWSGTFDGLERCDADGRLYTYTVREDVGGVSYGDGDSFASGGALVRVSIEGDEARGFTVTNTAESAATPPATGVGSPVGPAGAGLLASAAGMAAAWFAAARRRRSR